MVPLRPVEWTLDKKDLTIELRTLQLETARSRDNLRGGESDLAKGFAGRLFDAFFPTAVQSQFDQCRLLHKEEESLRIRLRVQADSLGRVPWELL